MASNYLTVDPRPSKIPIKSTSTSLLSTPSFLPRPSQSSHTRQRSTTTPKVHKRRTSSTSSGSSQHWLTNIFSSTHISKKKTIKSIIRLSNESQDNVNLWKIEEQSIRHLSYKNSKKFEFDHVFRQNISNIEIFNTSCIKSLVQEFVNGYNGTLFTYGQPGTGKTYTMYGKKNEPGLIQITLNKIFELVKNDNEHEYLLSISCFEIINETIKDLSIDQVETLKISDDNKRRGAYVSSLKDQIITSPLDVIEFISKVEANRFLLSNDYENHSSRAHTFIQITLERRDKNQFVMKTNSSSRTRTPKINKKKENIQISYFYLIDLASNDKSIYQNMKNPINKSCLALEAIVHNLSETGKTAGHPLPPYHDSKLTRLLQPTFQGQHYVVCICTVDLKSAFQDEIPTLDTLNFASRIRKIPVSPKICEILDEKSNLVQIVNDLFFLNLKIEKLKEKEEWKDIKEELEKRWREKKRMILSNQSNFESIEKDPWLIIKDLKAQIEQLMLTTETKSLPEHIAELEAELNITKAELQVTQLLINENKFI